MRFKAVEKNIIKLNWENDKWKQKYKCKKCNSFLIL